MKYLHTATALFVAASLTIACSKQEEGPAPANPLLGMVPADTPYVFANLQPLPDAVVDAWLVRAEPFLQVLQDELDQARTELEETHHESDPQFSSVAGAVLAELDGKFSRAGLESLGISLQSTAVVHGDGMFPVVRLGLGDAQALRDAIARIEAASGAPIPERQFNGAGFWRIDGGDGDLAAYIAILDDHLALGAAPPGAEADFLPGFLGQRLPERSIADSGALVQLNQDKQFLPYGSGYLDVGQVATEFLDAGSRTAHFLAKLASYDPTTFEPACALEARLVSSFAPRMVAGTTVLDADTLGVQYRLETKAWLAKDLGKLVADVPPASDSPDNVMAASLSLRLGRVREFLRDRANAVAKVPFACSRLQDLNRKVEAFAQQMNQPLPLPFLGNLMGARLQVSELDAQQPQSSVGLVSVEMESPQMVIGMAGNLIPGFAELGIEPGAEPVQIPEELMSVVTPEIEVHAVMTHRAIGVSFGPGQRERLLPFMEQAGGSGGVFASVDYDAGAFTRGHHGQVDVADLPARAQRLQGHAVQLIEAWNNMAGRSRVEFRFADDGLVIDSRMTFH